MAGTREYIRELKQYIAEKSSQEPLFLYESRLPAAPAKDMDVDAFLQKYRKEAFREILFGWIDRRGLTDPEIYHKARLDRRLFSKIRANANYRPSKLTVVALILALKLELDEAEELLETGGYSLSYADTFDLIIRFCLEKRIYNLFEVNELLNHYDQKTLGSC